MDILEESKKSKLFVCEKCDFKCNKQSNWDRHIVRPKHLNEDKNIILPLKHVCDNCGKNYTYSSGLWKHKKKCILKPMPLISNEKNIIDLLINEFKEFNINMLEMMKNTRDSQIQMFEMMKNTQDVQIQMFEMMKTTI